MIRKTFLKVSVPGFLLIALILAPQTLFAELIKAPIDTFSPIAASGSFTSNGSGTVFSDGTYSVERTVSGPTGPNASITFNQVNGLFFVSAPSSDPPSTTVTFKYEISGGNFAQFFQDTNPVSSSIGITGFEFGAAPFEDDEAYNLSLNGTEKQDILGEPVQFASDGDFNTATFVFTFGGNALIGSSNFSAVPEPTSLILFGSVAGLIFFRRRR